MLTRPWDTFARERIARIIEGSGEILDVGGGLRIDRSRNNRFEPKNTWMQERMKERGVRYKVLDYVPDYHPDIVGDVQNLPLADNSQEAIICNAVLEHVEDPFKAARELYRTLKSGGFCFVYVPFLYYYHAERGYYGDYWRFTEDSLKLLFNPFRIVEIQKVRGPFETLVRLTPFGRIGFFGDLAFLVDRLAGKLSSSQTSGYFVYLQK